MIMWDGFGLLTADFSSPIQVTPLFRSLASAIPSPQFSESVSYIFVFPLYSNIKFRSFSWVILIPRRKINILLYAYEGLLGICSYKYDDDDQMNPIWADKSNPKIWIDYLLKVIHPIDELINHNFLSVFGVGHLPTVLELRIM